MGSIYGYAGFARCAENNQIEIVDGTEFLWEYARRMSSRVLLLCRVRLVSKLYKEGLLMRRAG